MASVPSSRGRSIEEVTASSLPNIPTLYLRGHDGPIHDVCFTSNNLYCVTAGHDRTARLWNPLCKANNNNDDDNDNNNALAVAVYNGFTHSLQCIATHDTTLLAGLQNGNMVIADLTTQQIIQTYRAIHQGCINDVEIATPSANKNNKSNGNIFISASYDAKVKLWDARQRSSTTPIQTLSFHSDSVTSLHYDDNNYTIYTTSVDGQVSKVDIRRGEQIISQMCPVNDNNNDSPPIVSMTVSENYNDGLVVNCLDGTLRRLDKDLTQISNVYHGHHVATHYSLGCGIIEHDFVLTGSEATNNGTSSPAFVAYDLKSCHHVATLQQPQARRQTTAATISQPTRAMVTQTSYHQTLSARTLLITTSFDGMGIVWTNNKDNETVIE